MKTTISTIGTIALLAATFIGGAQLTHAQDAYDDGSRYSRGTATSSASSTISADQQKEILQALQTNGVYVSPGMRDTADANALAKSARDSNAKILVMDALPGRASIGKVAATFHKALNMGDGLMIVAVGGSRPQVAANGGNRVSSQSELGDIVKSQAAIFRAQGYTQGIQAILKAHSDAEKSAGTSSGLGLLFLIGVPTAGGVWYFRRKKSQDAARELRLRDETRKLSNELAPQYEKLDSDFEYAILGADADRQRELREARNDAGEAFSTAMKQFNNAQNFPELLGARASLMRARDAHDRSRAILEGKPLPEPRATAYDAGGGPGSLLPPSMQNTNAPNADEPFEIGPLGQGYAGARPGYGLDFFTSEPVPLDQMVPVDLDVNGQKRRVWASHDSAQRAMSGQAQVATVQYQGQNVPWYQAQQQYNPWNDFGSTMLTMMAMNMMMNTMFSPFGYGGMGYGGFGHHHDYGGGFDNGYVGGDNGGWVNTDNDAGSGVADLDLFGGGGGDSGGGFDMGDLFGGGGDSGSGVGDLDLFN